MNKSFKSINYPIPNHKLCWFECKVAGKSQKETAYSARFYYHSIKATARFHSEKQVVQFRFANEAWRFLTDNKLFGGTQTFSRTSIGTHWGQMGVLNLDLNSELSKIGELAWSQKELGMDFTVFPTLFFRFWMSQRIGVTRASGTLGGAYRPFHCI